MGTRPPRAGVSEATSPTGRDSEDGVWAGRGRIRAAEVDRTSRAHWEADAASYQAEHGPFLADGDPAGAGFRWGPEGLTEAEAGLLGPAAELVGTRVLEVGCGAGQCSAWLARHGAIAVGVDIAVNQLRHAPSQVAGPDGGSLNLLAASATALPFEASSFDSAFASYGAIQFVADLPGLLAEVSRVLRPGGRWVFSVTHPIRWAFPDEPDADGLTVSGSYFDRTPYVERDGSGAAVYAEFHRTLGDYVAATHRAGFTIVDIVEPEWPEWNRAVWGGWSPLRGRLLPGTMIMSCRAGGP